MYCFLGHIESWRAPSERMDVTKRMVNGIYVRFSRLNAGMRNWLLLAFRSSSVLCNLLKKGKT
jgi:hypothetical protein